MKLVLDRIMREISQKSVLDFIVAGTLLLFLLFLLFHLEAVLLHDGAQLIPCLVRDVHLKRPQLKQMTIPSMTHTKANDQCSMVEFEVEMLPAFWSFPPRRGSA